MGRMEAEHHAAHHEHERRRQRVREPRAVKWFRGFMIGGLLGLGAALLVAPQKGEQTREMLRYKATQLKQLAEQTADDTREKVDRMTSDARMKMASTRQRGRAFVAEQKERVTRVAQAAREGWQQGAEEKERQAASMAHGMGPERMGPSGGMGNMPPTR